MDNRKGMDVEKGIFDGLNDPLERVFHAWVDMLFCARKQVFKGGIFDLSQMWRFVVHIDPKRPVVNWLKVGTQILG